MNQLTKPSVGGYTEKALSDACDYLIELPKNQKLSEKAPHISFVKRVHIAADIAFVKTVLKPDDHKHIAVVRKAMSDLIYRGKFCFTETSE